jgi:hypothetical protein
MDKVFIGIIVALLGIVGFLFYMAYKEQAECHAKGGHAVSTGTYTYTWITMGNGSGYLMPIENTTCSK